MIAISAASLCGGPVFDYAAVTAVNVLYIWGNLIKEL